MDDVGNRRALAINLRSVVANKCIGENYSSLQTFCALMGLSTPVSKNTYTQYSDHVTDKSIVHAEEIIHKARQEVHGATLDKERCLS